MAKKNNLIQKTIQADESMQQAKSELKVEANKAQATYKIVSKLINNGTGKLVYQAIIQRRI